MSQTTVISARDAQKFAFYSRMAAKAQRNDFAQTRRDSNAALFTGQLNEIRNDSVGFKSGSGLHFARDLEHVYADVVREDYPDNDALALFPVDSSVPAGAKYHTVQRLNQTGRPRVHRGPADDTPIVGLSKDEETFPVVYYTIGVEWDHFDALADAFANTSQLAESLRVARDSMLEFWNEKTWFGDAELGLDGVLNYRFLNKIAMTPVFSRTADPTLMLSALQRLVDEPHRLTKGIARRKVNAIAMSVRLYDIIGSVFFTGTNETVLERLIRTKSVRIATSYSLEGTGPDGTDCVFGFRAGDRDSVANVNPIGFTQLPMERNGYVYTIPCFMAHGGVIMRKPLGNILGYAEVA